MKYVMCAVIVLVVLVSGVVAAGAGDAPADRLLLRPPLTPYPFTPEPTPSLPTPEPTRTPIVYHFYLPLILSGPRWDVQWSTAVHDEGWMWTVYGLVENLAAPVENPYANVAMVVQIGDITRTETSVVRVPAAWMDTGAQSCFKAVSYYPIVTYTVNVTYDLPSHSYPPLSARTITVTRQSGYWRLVGVISNTSADVQDVAKGVSAVAWGLDDWGLPVLCETVYVGTVAAGENRDFYVHLPKPAVTYGVGYDEAPKQ
ncbi:MAG: hypothetical protein JW850_12870 [Thermoflexales bacterium]|nr:hypothetical protein [Thermoflexales bacterium]